MKKQKKLYHYDGPMYSNHKKYYGCYIGDLVDDTHAVSAKQARHNFEYKYNCICVEECVTLVTETEESISLDQPFEGWNEFGTILILRERGRVYVIEHGVILEEWDDE